MNRGKALWLIDAAYLFNAQRSLGGDFQFDYTLLRAKIEQDGEIWKAYYLNSVDNSPSELQEGFHNRLQMAPPEGPKIITVLYPLKQVKIRRVYCERCQKMVDVSCPEQADGEPHFLYKEVQKGVDVGLVTLALTLRDDYDTLILSSGDGDLQDAIEYLTKFAKKRLELVVFRYGVASSLQARSDRVYWIDDFREEVRKNRS